MKICLRYPVFLLVFLTVFCLYGQEEKHNQPRPESETATETEPQVDEGSIKLFLDKIEVVGEIEKPQAVFIIPGKEPEIDDIRIERSFFKEIFRPVETKGHFITKPVTEKPDRGNFIPW